MPLRENKFEGKTGKYTKASGFLLSCIRRNTIHSSTDFVIGLVITALSI